MRKQDKPAKVELIQNDQKMEPIYSYSLNKFFVPDTSINKIRLESKENIESYLGKDVMAKLDHFRVTIKNAKSSQCLTLYFGPGGVKNEFSEFEISSQIDKDKNQLISVADSAFITESGIRLYMTENDFKLIKGKPDSLIFRNNNLVYHYEINNITRSAFLKRYNMPIYSADYEFKDGYLIKFEFGFPYP